MYSSLEAASLLKQTQEIFESRLSPFLNDTPDFLPIQYALCLPEICIQHCNSNLYTPLRCLQFKVEPWMKHARCYEMDTIKNSFL